MKNGFSLIELMVVITLVMILSAIAIPVYKNYVIKAKIMNAFKILQSVNDKLLERLDAGTLGATQAVNGVTLTNGANALFNSPPVRRVVYYNGTWGIPAGTLFLCVFIEGLEGMVPSTGAAYVAPTSSTTGARNRLCIHNVPDDDIIDRHCGIWTTNPAQGSDLYIPPEFLPSMCNCTALNTGSCT